MCNPWCLDFVGRCLQGTYFYGGQTNSVLEVGSRDVNGSPRGILSGNPWVNYIGCDIEAGPGVDVIADALRLDEIFAVDHFDIVLSTELLEHVADWRLALYQMAKRLHTGGLMIITTRSPGFEYHPYPIDCWRFTIEHMQQIFVDPMRLMIIDTDTDLRKGKYSGVGVMAIRMPEPTMEHWMGHLHTIEVAKP